MTFVLEPGGRQLMTGLPLSQSVSLSLRRPLPLSLRYLAPSYYRRSLRVRRNSSSMSTPNAATIRPSTPMDGFRFPPSTPER